MSRNVRQELYDRIRESSKDEVILEEMIRLGYWPKGEGLPSAPGELIKRYGEVSRELRELYQKQGRWADPERALKEMHKERKREAMQRRGETRLRRATERHERAQAWFERRKTEILYLGEDVSGGLTNGKSAAAELKWPLPVLPDMRTLASAMGLPLAELRFLAYDRPLSRVSHYQRFLIPKKAGGHRLISAPMPRLKRAQYWILDNILAKVPLHDAAHGFVPDRSIVTNASAHVGRDVVINLDLKDFFPTLTWRRIKGKFLSLGYSESISTVLALICTEPDVDQLELDGERLFARKGPRRLPQGAPTSPTLTNLICLRLDKRLSGLAQKLGFTYTRYADDMSFSASGETAGKTGTLLKAVNEIVTAEGFVVHSDKTRIMRSHRRQEVTGLVVNDRVSVPRDTLRRFRALLHQIEGSGPDGKSWGKSGNVLLAADGFAHFVHMVDRKTGLLLIEKVASLRKHHGGNAAPTMQPPAFRLKSAEGKSPLESWWTPAEPEAPKPEPILAQHMSEVACQGAHATDRPRSVLDDAINGRRRAAPGTSNQPTANSAPEERGKSGAVCFAVICAVVAIGIALRLPWFVTLALAMLIIFWMRRRP